MDGFIALCWNPDDCDYDTVLYMGMKWTGKLGKRFASFEPIYGDAIGGYLLKNDLRVAVLPDHEIYGIWNIRDLRRQPEVKRAFAIDPAIEFFMEDSNVWFYGMKKGDLYVFDAEFDELDSLGPIEPAIHKKMDEIETSRREALGY